MKSLEEWRKGGGERERENFPIRRNTWRKGLGVENYRTCCEKWWWPKTDVRKRQGGSI